jgi:cellulose synthase/poly-beta-1,6-N-acetylglucosamine synthase-like glycosyltransferase
MKTFFDDAGKLVFCLSLLIALPAIFYVCWRQGGLPLINIHRAIATLYLVNALLIMFEITIALSRRYSSKLQPHQTVKGWNRTIKRRLRLQGAQLATADRSLPRCTFIVAAYLPNEQSIILETLEHLLLNIRRSQQGLEVILAYNTPNSLPIEHDLQRLGRLHPELRLHKVEGSRSKAENINSALNIVTGEITCILDADHHPAPDCFERAWRWISHGYHVVQGRNIVRNYGDNTLTQLVGLEFEAIYGISHPAKSFVADTALFGGSNGYWKTEVLQQIRFNPLRLTEDIDASVRTLLNGYRLIHDRSILTTELAPTNLAAFWSQRKRWAQGWLEVTLRYQRRFWRCPHCTPLQRLYWTYLLYFREIYPIISLQILPIVFSALLVSGFSGITENPYLFVTTFITLLSGPYQTLGVLKVAAQRYPWWMYWQYALLSLPFTLFKNVVAMVALYDHIHGHNRWVVTPRSSTLGNVPPTAPTSSLALATLGERSQ